MTGGVTAEPPRPIPVEGQEARIVGLRAGEALAALGGLGLLVSLFLPWYGYVPVAAQTLGPGADLSRSAWEAFAVLDVLLVLVALIGLAVAALAVTQRAPSLPVATAVWAVPVAGVATLLVLVRILSPPGDDGLVTVSYGAFGGLGGTMLIVAGAWLALRDEGTD